MPLDLGNLRDATNAMSQVVSVSEDPVFMNAESGAVRNAIRAGVIQHFEFTYELCCNLMRRWLREKNMNRTWLYQPRAARCSATPHRPG